MADWLLIVPRTGEAAQVPDVTLLAPALRADHAASIQRRDVEGAAFWYVCEADDDPGVVGVSTQSGGRFDVIGSCLLTEREELLAALAAAGRPLSRDAAAGTLLAHAVAAWGPRAWERMAGEFAAAAWSHDDRTVTFSADGEGMRPVFWAQTHAGLLASTRFEAMMIAPGLSREPDRTALLGFLAGIRPAPDSTRTWLEEVKELPPGTSLHWRQGAVRSVRWWALPSDPLWHPKSEAEAVERFRTTLRQSVRERLRGHRRVAIALTGGMDSTAVAAEVTALRDEEGTDLEITAVHAVYPPELHSSEASLAEQVARSLDIVFVPVPLVGVQFWPRSHATRTWPPHVWHGLRDPLAAALSESGTVILTGISGEMFSRATLTDSFERGRLQDLVTAWRSHRRMRLPFRFWRPAFWRRSRKPFARATVPIPPWIHPTPAGSLPAAELRRRLSSWHPEETPARLAFLQGLRAIFRRTSHLFEFGTARVPTLDPFGDRRVLRLAASIAPVPWRMQKYLVRRSMEGVLPREVLTRPRSPTPWFPQILGPAATRERLHPLLMEFVNVPEWRNRGGRTGGGLEQVLWVAPLVVSDWLRELEVRT
jgi:asparagine synthase (glutamine-hydrolysing)